ncbi:flagellar basal body-associated protein FliL [Paludibacterium paludis]|uniref:Flagellar protein FliL n=1 Tax=Paludibacterium paludis TaxID=1225769 RepID=A0A918NXU9_9NEIS|nr:flagellar basal body-associated protein FliL [Paludibacterium paludis]GGY04655.1 hypothetical protein GCM10011289_03980 [Paludibacterium paludis]
MLNKSALLMVVLGLLIGAGAGGGAWYFMSYRNQDKAPAHAVREAPRVEGKEFRYVTLDKVIIMLRDDNGGPASHYLSTDLVFRTTEEGEKKVKEQLPYLRSLTVSTLSVLTTGRAGQLTVEQYRKVLGEAYAAAYARDAQERPFLDVMVGRLIIE